MNLKQIKEQSGLNMVQISELSGISYDTCFLIINGKRDGKQKTIDKLLKAMNYTDTIPEPVKLYHNAKGVDITDRVESGLIKLVGDELTAYEMTIYKGYYEPVFSGKELLFGIPA